MRQRPLPGTGRLGVVTLYFHLIAVFAAVATVGIGVAVFVQHLGWTTIPRNPWVALISAAALTVGCFKTARLLSARRKAGAQMAALSFAASLVGYFTGAAPGALTVAFAGCGLLLLASVWRYLE